jgi:hypothetical protein
MRSDEGLERELDNLTFALQRDLLVWRLARLHDLPNEEKWKRCLEQLHQLRDLLTEIEAFLIDEQEGSDSKARGRELTTHSHSFASAQKRTLHDP